MSVDATKRLVLVVDDEPDVLRYQAAILEDAGFEVMTAGDGNEALEMLETRVPDLVSLDLVMPGKSGIKFMHSLRRNRAWAQIPVIIVTGHAHDDQGKSQLRDAESMASGPQLCLEKPVSPATYVSAVRERLGIASLEVGAAVEGVSSIRGEIDALLDRAGPALLAEVHALLRGEDAEADGGPAGPKVLVIDDEEDVARTIAVMLEDGGYDATCVNRPGEAVAKAQSLLPDLITLDVDMPGMSGVEVYAAIRAEPALASVPVLVVTGIEEDARPRFAALPGIPDVDGYLKKPVDPERLLAAAKAARQADRPAVEAESDDDRKTILIVEDEEDVRAFLRGLFEDNDYATMEAANGDDAWKLVREKRPDLVTLDIQMPGESGTRFYSRLIRDDALKSIPVIVISGVAGKHLAVGDPVAVFDKPIDRQALLTAVVDAIE